jgi:class 3 adenylate cyclase
MATVIKSDFEGVRVQFQGDRVQGLFHVPKDEHAAISLEVIECSAGLHASMELTLKEALPAAEPLHLAVGVDRGKTLASKLGTRAHRDRICLGHAVEEAAKHEEQCEAGETGIGECVYKLLPEEIQAAFEWKEERGCYVASALTVQKLARFQRAKVYERAAAITVVSSGAGAAIKSGDTSGGRQVVPSRSYCGE